MPKIILEHVTKRWDKFYGVDDLNLVIENNSFVTLLGPSGCGKTTTLRMIAGLETPTSGKIIIGDEVVYDSEEGINIPANKRKVGFLFQNYALWPNMTVYENISFGLKNINELLPVKYDAAKAAYNMKVALEKPGELVNIIKECYDKKGKLDENKALIKIIDRYEISQYSAKKLLKYNLHNQTDSTVNTSAYLKELDSIIESAQADAKSKDGELSKDFTLVKNGEVQKTVRKLTKEEIDLSVRRVSRIVKIGMFMDRYPAELSGGQQQRVAIARTLAPQPQVLFMDEPLSNLDAKLRLEMRYELQRLHIETGSTFVYVTHDQMEAMTLATKICLINNGVLQQYDAPLTVYNRPNNLFVADFVGNPSINFVEAKGSQNSDGVIALSLFDGVKASFRPEASIDMSKWFSDRDEENARKLENYKAVMSDKKAVEKGNKDEVFKYHISMVNEDDFSIKEEPVITNEDFVIGIRPERIKIGEGKLVGEIYGAMPTGMESTIKLRLKDYLLTSVVFGGNTFDLGANVNFDIAGDVFLFDRASGKFITSGSLMIE